MRAVMIDPSLFTLPYDRALCAGLTASGCAVALVGRKLRPPELSRAERPLPLLPHFYRWTEPQPPRTGRLRRLAKSAEHVIDMARLAALCERLHPDVIHVQWLPLPVLDRHFLARLRASAPLVLTVHNSVPFHGAAASRLQLMAGADHYDAFDQLIAHTPTTRHHLVERGIDPGRINIVPHGLLPLAPALDGDRAPSGRCRVLFFGELKPYKGLDLLIEAVAQLPEPERRLVTLHVAGRPRMPMEPLFALARARGLADQESWDLRFIPEDEVGRLFAACDVVALPYHDVDSSGVLSLAIAAGKAVVASAVGGFRDLLTQDETALLARLDPVSFSAALGRLVGDATLRAHLAGNLAALGAGGIPSWDEIGRTTVTVYERAIAAWRGAPALQAVGSTPRRA